MPIAIIATLILWPLYFVASVVLWLIGWPLCAFLVWRGKYRSVFVTRYGRTLLEWSPKYAYPWGNDEDGIDGLRGGDVAQYRWMKQTAGFSTWWRILKWSCNRNPVGNLRFIPPFGFIIEPARVSWVGNSSDPLSDASWPDRKRVLWFFAWHGIYSGLWITIARIQIRIGWKLKPSDVFGVTDYRAKGCGFALQYRVLP